LSERCFVGLGSNLGDREANLKAACARLEELPGLHLLRRSGVYESAPVGVLDQPWFLNAVAEIETTLEPLALLHALKTIEVQLGRQPGRRWGERVIDLDLLLYGNRSIQSSELTVPHPRLWERLFVLLPLAELAPELQAPDGRPIGDLIAELASSQIVRRVTGVAP
jgi:2-amino-4-hydroxy-6-hydroxymethyldihydropteridine diphosphokinase